MMKVKGVLLMPRSKSPIGVDDFPTDDGALFGREIYEQYADDPVATARHLAETAMAAPETVKPRSEREQRRIERLQLIDGEEGFYPHSLDELSVAAALVGDAVNARNGESARYPVGAPSYLAQVTVHQRGVYGSYTDPSSARFNPETHLQTSEDMERAALSRLKDMMSYHDGARADHASLIGLIPLVDRGGEDRRFLGDLLTPSEWLADGLLRRGVATVLRFREAHQFASGEGADHLGDNYSKRDGKVDRRLEKLLKSTPLSGAMDELKVIQERESKRWHFWHRQLELVARYGSPAQRNILDTKYGENHFA